MMEQSRENEVLTVKEVADRFGVTARTVERWIEEKRLTADKAALDLVILLLASNRIKGIPPKSVWVIPEVALAEIKEI